MNYEHIYLVCDQKGDYCHLGPERPPSCAPLLDRAGVSQGVRFDYIVRWRRITYDPPPTTHPARVVTLRGILIGDPPKEP
jgi:hypothetical protein